MALILPISVKLVDMLNENAKNTVTALTGDILHVKEILGHKSLNNTMIYTQLINFKNEDYTASVAHSEDEACKLVEAGFEYICDFNRNKLFRKRK